MSDTDQILDRSEYINLTQAAQALGITNVVMARLVRKKLFNVYGTEADRRQKLVLLDEVRQALEPKEMEYPKPRKKR